MEVESQYIVSSELGVLLECELCSVVQVVQAEGRSVLAASHHLYHFFHHHD